MVLTLFQLQNESFLIPRFFPFFGKLKCNCGVETGAEAQKDVTTQLGKKGKEEVPSFFIPGRTGRDDV